MGLPQVDTLWQTASRIRYRCSACQQIHDGLPDIVFDAPHYYYAVPEHEREQRCELTSDLCVIDGQDYFVRCLLELSLEGADQRFGWGVWSSLSGGNFNLYRETFDDLDQGRLGPFFGWFSSRLPGYDDTLLLKCSVQPQNGGARPLITLEPTSHELVVEQREGMPVERAIGFARRVGAKLVID